MRHSCAKFFALTLCGLVVTVAPFIKVANAQQMSQTQFDWSKPQDFKVAVTKDKVLKLTYGDNLFKVAVSKQKLQILIDNTKPDNDFVGTGLVRVGDLNFDGYNDLAIDTGIGYGGVNVFSRVFFWQPSNGQPNTGQFSDGLDISNFGLNTAKKYLTSEYKSGPFHYQVSYKFDAQGPYKYKEIVGPGPVAIVSFFSRSGKRIKRILVDPNRLSQDDYTPAILSIAEKTYLYSKPVEEAKTKAYLIKGDKVTMLDVSEYPYQWYKVRYEGKKPLVRWIKTDAVDDGY